MSGAESWIHMQNRDACLRPLGRGEAARDCVWGSLGAWGALGKGQDRQASPRSLHLLTPKAEPQSNHRISAADEERRPRCRAIGLIGNWSLCCQPHPRESRVVSLSCIKHRWVLDPVVGSLWQASVQLPTGFKRLSHCPRPRPASSTDKADEGEPLWENIRRGLPLPQILGLSPIIKIVCVD